jgi:hypothetical protein
MLLFFSAIFWAWSQREPAGFSLPQSGDAEIKIPCAGTYTLWYEVRSMRNGSFHESAATYPSGAQVSFQTLPQVKDVPLIETMPRVYETAATKRVALAEVIFPTAGAVQVMVVAPRHSCVFYLTSPLQFSGDILQVLVVGSVGLVLSLAGVAASFQRGRRSQASVSGAVEAV